MRSSVSSAATNGPTESRRAQQGGGKTIPCQGLGSVQFGTSGFRRVARRFPARGWDLAEQTKLPRVEAPFPPGVLQHDGALRARHGVLLFAGEDSPQCPARGPRPLVPASPSASQPPLLKLRGLAASQPPALQPIPEACLEYNSSTAFLLLSPASGSGWRVARHTCWANTASPGGYRQHRWGYTAR